MEPASASRWQTFSRAFLLAGRPGLAIALCSLLLAGAPASHGESGKIWSTGLYSFSDELGGFTITSVKGKGTRADPVTITEILPSASPVTLVIRTDFFSPEAQSVDGLLYMRIITRNGSQLAWIEFEFELQELLHQASLFEDGLSFDQRKAQPQFITSDSFRSYSRDFEPYDKLLFRNGGVDPTGVAEFSFLITDFTPRSQFYLVQDPRIPTM